MVAKFNENPKLEMLGNYQFRVIDPLVYACSQHTNGAAITVPEGFVTDLASIPRILWDFLPPDGSYAPAAIVHDYLYTVTPYDRATCDKILLEAMAALGVPIYERDIIYGGVRLGGQSFYGVKK
jgi:hypothetical protein